MKALKILALLATSLLIASAPALAQEHAPVQEPPEDMAEVTDAELTTFADAYIATSIVREEYTQRIQEADDPAEQEALQREGNEAIVTAIEENGMEVDRYEEVALAINADEELRDRILAKLEERQ